jgi:hypothetical protein
MDHFGTTRSFSVSGQFPVPKKESFLSDGSVLNCPPAIRGYGKRLIPGSGGRGKNTAIVVLTAVRTPNHMGRKEVLRDRMNLKRTYEKGFATEVSDMVQGRRFSRNFVGDVDGPPSTFDTAHPLKTKT